MTRPRRLAFLLLATAALTLPGCGFAGSLDALRDTDAALESVGFIDPRVTPEVDADTRDVYAVVYERGPSIDATADRETAARIVWSTLPYRVSALNVAKMTMSRRELEATFGPRPSRLDVRRVGDDLKGTGTALVTVGPLVLLGAIAVAFLGIRRAFRD